MTFDLKQLYTVIIQGVTSLATLVPLLILDSVYFFCAKFIKFVHPAYQIVDMYNEISFVMNR